MFLRFASISCLLCGLIGVGAASVTGANPRWSAGFARVEITPDEPVRMAGYGSRNHASEGIDTRLFARAVALQADDGPTSVLIAVDTIGLPGTLTRELARQLEQRHGLSRARIAFCSTHTHCAPDLVSELSNIFAEALTEAEQQAGTRYRQKLAQGILDAVDQAMADRGPAILAHGSGTARFAANRRVLKDGVWTGFGVQEDGPVDHSVPVIRISSPAGELRGVLFNYACHCTTLGGEHYRINSEWAGYAAEQLEKTHAGMVALCTIGCGADANPNPRGSIELAQQHGLALASEVQRLLTTELKELSEPIDSQFAYAGLSFDLPTMEELKARENDPSPQARRHAVRMQESYREHGRLPATYPVPIQSWKFGDQLTMIFIGGEVVVDYALRLKREFNDPALWVTAYANDVLGYVASERMRAEGGYEFDRSGIYYGLPGPWASGSEDLLVRRIQEMLKQGGMPQPLDPSAALKSFRYPADLELQLIASEPQLADPVNFAFGFDGELWVVEMGDYPLGNPDAPGGGRIKRLTDPDGDGIFDQMTVFLDGIDFPTGVHPWGDGVLVSAAPDILFARDTDHDGVADTRDVWYSGFALANPQHRINGFTYGLDHSLHCASGDNLGEITAVKTNNKVNASGRDIQVFPETGVIATVAGRTQFVRSRNDWGDWFGNDNSRPMWHYPIDDRYLQRNPHVRFPSNLRFLFDPPAAPPVFPASVTVDRFNDLFAANRFTSACSAMVFRSSQLGPRYHDAAIVCEPVHNLVHLSKLALDGASFVTHRMPEEEQGELLASTDPMSRPVRAVTGVDGQLWIVDMYRAVIEHPEWIPEAWQQQLDLREGSNRGRIYRLAKRGSKPVRLPRIREATDAQLVQWLEDDSGALRDLAQQQLIHRASPGTIPKLRELVQKGHTAVGRLHAAWTLNALGELTIEDLRAVLQSDDANLLRGVMPLCESHVDQCDQWLTIVVRHATHENPAVRLQAALLLGFCEDERAGEALARMAIRSDEDPWVQRGVISSASHHAPRMLEAALKDLKERQDSHHERELALIADLLLTAKGEGLDVAKEMTAVLSGAHASDPWVVPLTAAWLQIWKPTMDDPSEAATSVRSVYKVCRQRITDQGVAEQERIAALRLMGIGLAPVQEESQTLVDLLVPKTPLAIQLAAIDRLASFKEQATADRLIESWPTLTQSARDRLIGHMLTIRSWTEALITALESGKVRPGDLTAASRQQLRHSGTRSMQVRAERVLQDANTDRRKVVEEYLAAKVDALDTSRGEALFKKHCAACHLPDDQGRAAGPNLTNLTDRSDRFLMEAILDPNRAVDPQYRSYTLLLEDGRVITGVIAEEVGASLTVARPDGTRATFARSEIEELRNTGLSLMPEGLQKDVSPQEMREIVRHVQQLRGR